MDCKKRFSKNLKKYMDTLELTQKDLREKLDVSKSIVSDWCNGKAFPRADKLDELCNLLNIDIVDLFIDKRSNIDELNDVILQLDNEYQNIVLEQAKTLLKMQKSK